MPEFVLKNNYFELNGKVKQQLLGAAIGTKSAPPLDACIFMDKVQTGFLEIQKRKPMVWFLYTDALFLFQLAERRNYSSSLKNLLKLIPI